MPEITEKKEKAIAVNVNLKPIEESDQPVSANFTTVGIAQGIAYLDFGFIEPSQLAKAVNTARNANGNGKPVQETVNGKLVMRTAIGLDVLQRLHGQLQQVLVGVKKAREAKPNI